MNKPWCFLIWGQHSCGNILVFPEKCLGSEKKAAKIRARAPQHQLPQLLLQTSLHGAPVRGRVVEAAVLPVLLQQKHHQLLFVIFCILARRKTSYWTSVLGLLQDWARKEEANMAPVGHPEDKLPLGGTPQVRCHVGGREGRKHWVDATLGFCHPQGAPLQDLMADPKAFGGCHRVLPPNPLPGGFLWPSK